jgi:GntR family transcriptional repressor for pyruvate dehydrogenase complex
MSARRFRLFVSGCFSGDPLLAGRTRSSVPLALRSADASAGRLSLEPGQRMRLSDQLYSQIFDQIVAARLNVGDQLPSENEISERFGVSRPVVREALLRLRADGLVTSQRGRGTFVCSQPASRVSSLAGVENVAAYLRFQEVRIALEGDAARLCALRRTDEQMNAIERAHDAIVDSITQGRMSPQDDLAFHKRIAESAGNELYATLLDSMHEALSGFMLLNLTLTRTTQSALRAQKVLDEHLAIIDAIRARDGERARNAMQFHLEQARQRLINREKDN